MSNKKYYTEFEESTNTVIDETVECVAEVTEEIIEEVEKNEEVVEEAVEEETFVGVVTCAKLNVREKADIKSTSIYVVTKDDVLLIDTEKSTDEWYKVYTETGIDGFCMKKFVSVNN